VAWRLLQHGRTSATGEYRRLSEGGSAGDVWDGTRRVCVSGSHVREVLCARRVGASAAHRTRALWC
jgi:hypothetical protein